MSLIIGSVLPLRDRRYVKAVIDERGNDPAAYGEVMEEVFRLPHGSVIDLIGIFGGGSGAAYMIVDRCVRCDGTPNGMMSVISKDGPKGQPAPEEIQESGVWAVGQANDGYRAVACDPDAETLDDVMDDLYAMSDEESTVAGLPPLSMIEVHGPVVPHRTSSESMIMERCIVVIGEDGSLYDGEMYPVYASAEKDDGGDGPPVIGPTRGAESPGEILRRFLARIAAGKDLEDAERKWRGSRWRSPCPRPGSCR